MRELDSSDVDSFTSESMTSASGDDDLMQLAAQADKVAEIRDLEREANELSLATQDDSLATQEDAGEGGVPTKDDDIDKEFDELAKRDDVSELDSGFDEIAKRGQVVEQSDQDESQRCVMKFSMYDS